MAHLEIIFEDVLYDVESLFVSILVQKTIDYIFYKTYFKKELKLFCKNLILKKLLNKLTTECVFFCCPMGQLISVVLLDLDVCKMEEDIVARSKSLF